MKINQLKAGVLLSYISMAISSIISIAYTPILLRLLGQNEYGLYQLVASVVSYLGLLSFGFGSSYMRIYFRYNKDNDKNNIAKLNGMFMTIFLIISIISLIAGRILILNINIIFKTGLSNSEIETGKILMSLMIVNIAVSFPSSVFDSYITAHEQYIFQRIIMILQALLNPFLTLPLLLMGYKSISLVLISTLLTFSKLFINMWYCLKKLNMRFIFKKYDINLFKEISSFSFYIFLNMIIDQVNWSVDKYILGMFKGSAVVAIYSAGSQINQYYLSISTSISNVFIPKVNKIIVKGNDNKILTDLFIKVGRVQFIILTYILLGFIILGRYFISIWAGKGYENSYFVAIILIIPVTIPLIQNLGIEIQKAKNMHQFRSIIYALIALGNLCISIPLAKKYGEIGSAIGTCLTLLIGNGIIMNLYYQFKIKLDMIYFWKEILKLFVPSMISFIIGLFIINIYKVNDIISFLIMGVLFSIIYFLLIWFLGMNNYEKNLIINILHKFIRKKDL